MYQHTLLTPDWPSDSNNSKNDKEKKNMLFHKLLIYTFINARRHSVQKIKSTYTSSTINVNR